MVTKRSIPDSTADFARRIKDLQEDERGFKQLSEILMAWTGIRLDVSPKNLSLMASRLTKLMRENGFDSYAAVAMALDDADASLTQMFVQALTTNTTQFFREPQHFEIMSSYIKFMERKKVKKEWRLWCAAASRGHEAYTMVINTLESLSAPDLWQLKLLGTDIDLKVLEEASAGVYSAQEIEEVPALYREKYFEGLHLGTKRGFQAKDDLRMKVRFAPFNLMEPHYPFKQSFDVIFCRNVLIYFDAPTALDVIQKLASKLAPDGLLFLGHSEAGYVKTDTLVSIAPAVYRRADSNQLQGWKWNGR